MEYHKSFEALKILFANIWFLASFLLILYGSFPVINLSLICLIFTLWIAFQKNQFLRFFVRVFLFLLVLALFRFYDASGEIIVKIGRFNITYEQLSENMYFILRFVLVFNFIYLFLNEFLQFNLSVLSRTREKHFILARMATLFEELWLGILLLPEVFNKTSKFKKTVHEQSHFTKKSVLTSLRKLPEQIMVLYQNLFQFVADQLKKSDDLVEHTLSLNWMNMSISTILFITGILL